MALESTYLSAIESCSFLLQSLLSSARSEKYPEHFTASVIDYLTIITHYL